MAHARRAQRAKRRLVRVRRGCATQRPAHLGRALRPVPPNRRDHSTIRKSQRWSTVMRQASPCSSATTARPRTCCRGWRSSLRRCARLTDGGHVERTGARQQLRASNWPSSHRELQQRLGMDVGLNWRTAQGLRWIGRVGLSTPSRAWQRNLRHVDVVRHY